MYYFGRFIVVKIIIKYTVLLFFVLLPSIFILLSKSLYSIYVDLFYDGRIFYEEERAKIMFDVIYYLVIPLSVLISFLISSFIYLLKKFLRKINK